MDSLSLLTLTSPKRPRPHNGGCGAESESGSAFSTPFASAPSSPRRACFFREEVEEAPLGEVRPAIPFIWEHVPGTPMHDHLLSFADLVREEEREEEDGDQPARQEDSFKYRGEERQVEVAGDVCANGSDDVSGEPSSESEAEFDFGANFGTTKPGTKELNSPYCMSTAEELFLTGHMLPLSLPPRLRSLKQVVLQTSDSSRSDSSSCGSFSLGSAASSSRSQSPKSHHRGISSASRFLTLIGFTRNRETADVENVMSAARQAERIGHKRRKSRSLSPSHIFNNQDGDSSSNEATRASLDVSFTDLASYPAGDPSSLEGLKDVLQQQYKEKNDVESRSPTLMMEQLLPYTDNSPKNVDSPNNKAVISLLESSESLQSLSPIPEVEKTCDTSIKNQDKNQDCARTHGASAKESSLKTSDSRLISFTRFPFHVRKLKPSSRSAVVAPHDLHVKPFMFCRLRRIGGCIGFTSTTDEKEENFAGIPESAEENMESSKTFVSDSLHTK